MKESPFTNNKNPRQSVDFFHNAALHINNQPLTAWTGNLTRLPLLCRY
ncbi:hypothetical protein CKO_01254 [Citrobacter koseri ATCC BAA-895]|uniref:Uncharacterized protein n=1 Tax=Citrobacter koseri (strain ATCC BAA-895 / CDC 4225-83 / SGSC4696) TaxID=290338 RepID=A8AFY1_CITK8|nr:hypothetical protein CKO_01254 [Citrobacter koseri ATCC BAA-895]